MKTKFYFYTAILALTALPAVAADMVKISGSACEIFNDDQSKSSVRVRVTDKASYNAVSHIPSLMELRSQMLEHDYNVIIYNLVDNYVQNMTVRTTSQDSNELCVEVNGAIPAADIVTVIANYSPSNPAPEYDFKKANDIVEEEYKPVEQAPTNAEVAYNGLEEFDKIPEPTKSEPIYEPDDKEQSVDSDPTPTYIVPENSPMVDTTADTPATTLVYIAPVQFSNNTHSSKPISVLKEFFANEDLYTILDNPDGADYTITSKVLKAKIDSVNSQTKRMQMVVSIELKISGADGAITDHQNRFVLFKSEENEQEVAMNLLKKLLQKSGEKLIIRIEQNENKRHDRPFLRPSRN